MSWLLFLSLKSVYASDNKQIITISTQITHNACAGGKDGSIDISVSGGLAPYSFLWSQGNTTEDLLFVESGTYTVTVTDDAGIVQTAVATITEPSPVVINLVNLSNVTCYSAGNGSINISPSGGVSPYTYLWNNGSTVEDRVSLAPGLYTVLVTDDNGCSTNETYQITGPSLLTCNVSTVKAISCFGLSNGSAVINTNSGGTQPYTYTWSSGQTTQTATGLAAGLTLVTVTDANGCNSICGINMQQPTLLVANYTQSNVTTTGGSNGSIDVTVSGGSQPYTYLWNDGTTTQDRSGLVASTYILTVTDVKLCTKVTTVIITEPNPTVIASASGTNPTCNGYVNGSVTASANGGSIPYSFLWSTGSTNMTIINLPAGTYTVTVTDNGNITSSASVILTDPAPLQLNANLINPLCFGGNDGSITITPTGGTVPYSIQWLSGSTNFSIQNLVSNDYTCTVTDANGCTITQTYFLPDNPALSCSVTEVTSISCFGSGDAEALVQTIGGSPGYTYLWSDGQTTINALALVQGIYTATVTDSKGCTTSCQISIAQPQALSIGETHTDVTVSGGSNGTITTNVSGGVTPYTYLWNDGETTEHRANLVSGTYTVTVTDNNNCTASVVVFIAQPGNAPTVFCAATNINCAGQLSGQVNATVAGGVSPYTYLWSNGSTTANISGLPPGTYTVTVTDATGATVSGQADVLEPFFLSIFVLQVTDNQCGNGSTGAIDIDGDGGVEPYSFLWSTGSVTEDITNVTTGIYTVTITDANGCSATTTATVGGPGAITVNVTATPVSCNGLLNGGLSCSASGGTVPLNYLWSNGSTTASINALAAGNYTVTITDAAGCTLLVNASVTEPAALIVNETHADLSAVGANDGIININATGGTLAYTYLWNDGLTLENRNALPAGVYTVTVTDANSCSASVSIEIAAPTCTIAISETHNDVSAPNGSDGSIDITITGATGNASFLWNDGTTTEDRSNLNAGVYSVLVNDAINCTSSITITITAPNCGINLTANQSNVTVPNGNDGAIQITVTGGVSPMSFVWNDGNTNQNRSALMAATYTVTVTDDNNCTASKVVNITQPTCALSVTETHNNVTMPNGNDGSIDVTTNGGFAPVTFMWNDGNTNEDRNNLSAGTYTVTVTDAGGCTDTLSITINQPGCVLVVNQNHTDVTIPNGNDGSIVLTVSGAFNPVTYIWSDGNTNKDRNGLVANTYTVTVTDAGGCSALKQVTINQPSCGILISESHTDVTIPNGADGTINISVNGAFNPVTYVWNDGVTTQNRIAVAAGVYTVTATDIGNCTAVETITIIAPLCALGVSGNVSNVTIPGGNDGTITISVSNSNGALNFIWSNGVTNQNLQNMVAGSYTVTVTDGAGCTATYQASITQPVCGLNISANHTQVTIPNGNDGSIDITVSNAFGLVTYLWHDGNTNEDRNNLTSGTYTVTATDAGNCQNSETIIITAPACALILSQNHTDVTIPNGNDGSINVSQTGGFAPISYLWSDAVTTEDRSNLIAGVYTVIATDAGNCTASKQISILQPSCGLILSSSQLNVSIPGGNDGSISISQTGGYLPLTYLWNNGSSTASLNNLTAGVYTVTVTDAGTCTASLTLTITEPACNLSVSGNLAHVSIPGGNDGTIVTQVSGTFVSVQYLWSNGNTNADLLALSAGTYTVTVTDQSNCTAQAIFVINEPACVLQLSETHTDATLPGGNDGSINIAATGQFGQVQYIWNDGNTNEDRQLLNAGVYTVTATDAGNCTASKQVSILEPPCAISSSIIQTNVTVPNGMDGSIDLSITGAFAPISFIWNDGNTDEDRGALAAGTYTVTVTDAGNCTSEQTIIITQPLCQLSLSEVHSDVTTPGGTDGIITITVNNGIGTSVFLWNDGATTSDRINIGAGTYTVTVTDSVGCSQQLTITVNQPGCAIALNETHTNVTLPNGTDGAIDVVVTGSFGKVDYLWNDGVTTQDRNNIVAGTYTLTAADASNCIANINITITAPPCALLLTQNHTDVTIPNGNDGSINTSQTGGYQPISYAWSDGVFTEDRNNLAAGIYTVIATDAGGCTSSKQITITQPACNLSLSEVHTDVTQPNGSDGTIDITLNGAFAPVTFIWNDGATLQNRVALQAGTYTVTATDAGNCTSSQTIVIGAPPCNITLSETHANVTVPNGNNGSIDLAVSGSMGAVTFVWSNGATAEDIAQLTAGTYTVTVTDQNNCSATTSVIISQPGCALNVAATATHVSIPNGNDGSITLQLNGVFGQPDYNWSDGATVDNRINLSAGIYTVTITDVGCITSTSVLITQPACALSLNHVFTNVTQPNGSDGSIDITVSGAFGVAQFVWSDGNTNEDRISLIAGTYTVTVTDAGNCSETNTIIITMPNCGVSISAIVSHVTVPNGSDGEINLAIAGSNGTNNFIWNDGNILQNRTGLSAGTYTVTVTDANNCSASAAITVNQPTCALSITETHSNVSLPNGNDGSIDLTINGAFGSPLFVWNDGNTSQNRLQLQAGTYTVTVTEFGCITTTSVIITAPPCALIITQNHSDVTTPNGNNGSINVSHSGGYMPVLFAWSDGATTEDRSNLTAGVYTVVATDAGNCTSSKQITITQPVCGIAVSETHVDVTLPNGNDGSIDITVNGAFAPVVYMWSDGANTEDRNNLQAGIYTVTVTDAGGCTNDIAISIQQPACAISISATQTNVSLPYGSDGSIDVSQTNGYLPIVYIWNDGTTTEDRSNLPATTYTVTVTDAGNCTAELTIIITEPVCNMSATESHTDVSVPGGNDGSIDITVSNNYGPCMFLWSNGATVADINTLMSGTYTVTVTDSIGCVVSEMITINQPGCSISLSEVHNDVTIPNGNDGAIALTITGAFGSVNYLWDDGSTMQDRSNLPTGTYTVTATDASGCIATTSIFINEPLCQLVLTQNHTDVSLPNGSDGSINVTASGAYLPINYLWSDGVTLEDRNNLIAGVYTVTATDAGNCTASKQITITQPACIILLNETHIDVTTPNGSDGSIDVTQTGAFVSVSYIWNDGDTNEDRNNVSAGTYTVTATDAGSCTASAVIVINQPGCNISITETHTNATLPNAADGSIDITVAGGFMPVTYLWNDGDTNEDRSNLIAANYEVTVTDAGGCSASLQINISQPLCTIALTETHSDVTIPGGSDGAIVLQVAGNVGYTNFNWSNGSTSQNISGITSGVYTVTVTDSIGCSAVLVVAINEPGCGLSIIETHTDVSIPNANDGSIDITVTGMFGQLIYNWSDGNTNEDRSNLPTGTYTVTVTDAGNCMALIAINILQPPCALVLTQNHVDVSTPNGNDGSINVTQTGGFQPVGYIWNDGNTNEDRVQLTAGVYTVTATDAGGCTAEKRVTIDEPACGLTISEAHNNVSLPGGNDGSIDIIVGSAIGTVAYIWNDGNTNEDRAQLIAGTYTVTVADSTLCSAMLTVTITEPQCFLTVSETHTNISTAGANDGTIDLTVTGAYGNANYLWNDGSTMEDRSALLPGFYTVTITDSLTCTTSILVEITEVINPMTLALQASDVNCNGLVDSIWINLTGGKPGYNYNWSNGNTTAYLTQVASGSTYSLTVTDFTGATITDSITVSNYQPLAITVNKIQHAHCGIDSGAIDLQIAGGVGTISYLWNDGATILSRNALSGNMYSITVSDSKNCNITQTFTIQSSAALQVQLVQTTAIVCNGAAQGEITSTVTGGTTPYLHLWSDGQINSIANNLEAGTYTLTVTDINGCQAIDSITLTEPAPLNITETHVDVSNFGASDGSIDVTVSGATGPYIFVWSDGSTTEDLNNLPAGTYTVTVTDANGCFDITTIQILNPQCLIDASATSTNASIHGAADGAVTLSVINNMGAVTYVWSNGATTQNLMAVPAGIYTVLVTDAAGCTTGETVIVNEPNCDIQLAVSTIDVSIHGAADGSADLSVNNAYGLLSYDWSNGSTLEDQVALTANLYTVTVTDAGGCTKQINAIINQPTCAVSISETHTDATLHGLADGAIDITVSGHFGALQYNWSTGNSTEDLQTIGAGTYTVTVTDNGGCTASLIITVNEPPCNIAISEMHYDATVNGASDGFIDLTTANTAGFVTYLWSNGELSEDVYNLYAGVYTVTVTDAGNCSATLSVTISQPPCSITLSETHSDPTMHGSSDGSIDLTVTNANGTLTYTWNDGAFAEDRLAVAAGTYTVTVTDGSGCTAELTIVLVDPACALTVAYTKTDVTSIGANDGSIDITVNNAYGNIYYLWNDGNIFPDRNNLAPGTYTLSVTDAGGCFGAVTVIIGVATVMDVTLTSTDVLCYNDSNGKATAFVTGGAAPLTYAWSHGATTASVQGLPAGTYTVIVTDVNGGIDSATVTINQPVKLNGSKVITYTSCYGSNDGAIDLSVTGGVPAYTYAWDNGATTEDLTHLTAGLYKVVVTDQNGCKDKLRARVKQPKKIRPSGDEVDVTCFGGNDGSVVYTIGGGVPPYTFLWNDGVTTKDRTNMAAGTYTLSITDATGCVRVTEKTITQPEQIVITCSPVDVTTACSNDGHIFTQVTGGSNPFDYLWNDGATVANRHNLATGSYTVTVTDKKGCSLIQTVMVGGQAPVTVNGTVQQVSCSNPFGGSIQLAVNGGTAPYDYMWNTGATTDALNNVGVGSYTVTIADENNCTVSATFILNAPPAPTAITSGSNITCFGLTDGNATVIASGGTSPYTYLWNNGSTNTNIVGLSAGSYTATVTDALGCTAISSVTIIEPAKLIPLRNKTNVSCFGGNDGSVVWQTYGGTPLYGYLWSDGSTLSNRFNLTALLYTITIYDANGCTDTVSIKINQPLNAVTAQLNVTNQSSYCVNDGSIEAIGAGGVPPYSYLWSNGATTATATGLSATLYTVTVSDFNGCTYQGSANVSSPNGMSVSASITGTCTGASTGAIAITVNSGMPPYTFLWNDGSTLQNRSNLAATTYIVTVTDALSCTTGGSFVVTALPEPQITWAENHVTCNGLNNGTIDITEGVAAPYQYLWNNGATSQDVNNLIPSNYTVSVTNVLGCTAMFGFTISEPAVLDGNKTKQNVSCNGGNDGSISFNTTGGTAPYTYQWSNGYSTSSANNLEYGNYTVTITDANGCTISYSTKINEPTAISISTISTDCSSYGNNDGTATVTINGGGVGPYTYIWSNGQTNAQANQLISGTYTVTVTDANGCTKTANAFVNEPAPVCLGFVTGHVITYYNPPSGSDTLANYLDNNFGSVFNDSLVLGCNTGYTLSFTTAQAVKDFLPSNGNPKDLDQSFVNPDTVSLQNTLAAQLVALALNIRFDLTNPDFASMSTVNFRDLNIVEPGPFYGYTVQQLYDEANSFLGGCGSLNTGAQIRTMVSVVNSSWNLGTQTNTALACPGAPSAKFEFGKSASDELNLNAYPNPNRGNFNLSYYAVNTEPVTIKVMDVTGHQIMHFAAHSAEGYNKINLNLGEVPKGVYTLQFLINNQVRNLRLIVQ
ncbi:MAG: T9SS type A sorting domain-containing protein [Bacteroidia bacterium]|nr:T9SS type A sorting domain-containing protein [Bacteroidia bacterium]